VPDGYTGDFTLTGQLTVTGAEADNVLNVIYPVRRSDLSCAVRYLGPGGENLLAAKTVSGLTFESAHTESAPVIPGHTPDAAAKSVVITAGANEIVFNYAGDRLAGALTLSAISGREYLLPLYCRNIKPGDFTVKVSYDSAKLQLLDHSAQTAEKNTADTPGYEIISNTAGGLTVRVRPPASGADAADGEITVLRFKALASGASVITTERL
jgi:hypothetical protein